MDQRKVHVIAREVAEKIGASPLSYPYSQKGNWNPDSNGSSALNTAGSNSVEAPGGGNQHAKMKPICIHHKLLLGLQKPAIWPVPKDRSKDIVRTQMKMSKSIPGSAVFVHDSADEIQKKINKAFCPPDETDLNPVLDWVRGLIFPILGKFDVQRKKGHGGSITYSEYENLRSDYMNGRLHPMDLKNAVAEALIFILKPAREEFGSETKKKLVDQIRASQSR